MSTVKQFVFQEQIAGVNGLYIFAQKYNASTGLPSPTATQNSTFANQGDWAIPSQPGIDFYKSRFSNWTYSDHSKNIKIIWTDGDAMDANDVANYGQFADYRRPHPTFNTSASKCKITFNNPQIRIGGLVAIGASTGFVIKYTAQYKVINNMNTFTTVGPIEIYDTVPGYLQAGGQVGIPLPFNINFITMTNNLIQQGSLVTGGERNDIAGLEYNLRVDKDSGRPIGSSVNIGPAIYSTNVIREYECNLYRIDGSDGDLPPSILTNSILTASAGIIHPGSCNLITQSTLIENSRSVITGVQKTLQNNFTFTPSANVKYNPQRILRQETELLGTVFNFRFMEPVVVSSQHTSTFQGNIIRGLATTLSLSADVNATIQGNLIYDISNEYSWNDFNIIGYARSGYVVTGYAQDSADYSWLELAAAEWDSWPNSVWGGTEASWETWPEDVWNSTRRLLVLISTQQAAKLIASGVGQLLSRTSLSENAAFRIEGVPGEIRSDFLCDGSPSGLIGGSSTIISDAVLTALANYINQMSV